MAMAIPADHFVNRLWDDDDIPFDDSVDHPLTIPQLLTFLQSCTTRPTNCRPYDSLLSASIASVEAIDNSGPTPEAITHILRSNIKPLFSHTPNTALSTEGRQNQYQNTASNLISKYDSALFSEGAKPLKHATKWCLPLLTWLVHQISLIPENTLQQSNDLQNVFSNLTALLAPPILHLIDDSSIPVKALGASLLTTYCTTLSRLPPSQPRPSQHQNVTNQAILARTGLASVFLDALTPNFSLLPTLTPENESLFILRRLYPSYISVVDASTSSLPSSPIPPHSSSTAESHLTTLTNNGLNALIHISPSTAYPSLQTFLLGTLAEDLIPRLGKFAAPFLQRILPLVCREAICNPFGSLEANLPVLNAAVGVCRAICEAVPERVRGEGGGGWWSEILRGVVGAWIVLVDDADGAEVSKVVEVVEEKHDTGENGALKSKLKGLVRTLSDIVGEPFTEAAKLLVDEEEDLEPLFSYRI